MSKEDKENELKNRRSIKKPFFIEHVFFGHDINLRTLEEDAKIVQNTEELTSRKSKTNPQ